MKIIVLGCGKKPLLSINDISKFRGVHLDGNNLVVDNLDIVDYGYNQVADLSKRDWEINKSYDIVIAEHIAEHIPDRVQFMYSIALIANKGGMVIIEVPNWKHQDAYNTIDHYSQWGRGMFDKGNLLSKFFKKIKVEYQFSILGLTFYVPNEFIGRQFDRFTHTITSLRFYLEVI